MSIILIAFLGISVLSTDVYQSEQWIMGTRENPILAPAGVYAHEGNPFVAGRPEQMYNLARMLEYSLIYIKDSRMDSDRKLQLLSAWAAYETAVVIYNDTNMQQQGFDRRIMFKYRWNF